ncbi:MAG: LamG domain-containing protein [Verrucomicrobiota bacterium]
MKTKHSRLTPGGLTRVIAGLILLTQTAMAQQWTANTLPPGLIGWWQAEGNYLDTVGGNNLSPDGGVTFAPGRFGQAFHFDGITGSAYCTGAAALNGWTQFTLEAWINLDITNDVPNGSAGRGIISRVGNAANNGMNNYGYQFGTFDNSTGLFCQFNANGQAWPSYQTTGLFPQPLVTGVWYHVAATYDHNATVLYFNGSPLVTNVVGPVTIATSTSSFRISKDDNGNVPFPGRIDDVRIYNRALTAAEIAYLYTGPWPSYGAQIFPVVTNDTAPFGDSVACAGTNYLVGIQGDITTSDNYAITAQLFGPAGTPVGARISPVPGHTGGTPLVASSGTNFLMAWPDDYLGGSNSSISAQLVTPSGGLIGGMIAITTNSAQNKVRLVYGAGEYLAIWNDFSSGVNWAIYGQLVSASGALLGGNFLICPPANGQDEKGSFAAFDGTNFLVVLQYNSTAGGDHNVTSGVFVSPSGAVGTLFAIGQTISPNRNFASVLFNGTNYLVLWNFDSETNGAGNPVWNIYGRFVTPTGTFPGNEFPIVTNGNPLYPSAAFDGANYLMSWNVNFPATNSNVQFQFLNAGGQPMGPPFVPFPAQGSEVPMLTLPIYDGRQFVSVTTLSADGGTPTNNEGNYGAYIPASTAPPQFGPGSFYGNQQFLLSLAGTPGINYAIQMATNLAAPNWTALATNSPTNGPFTFTDTAATNGARFYRAVKR